MAGTYAEIKTLIGDAGFRAKVEIALIKTASGYVQGNDSGRIALGQRVIDGAGGYVERGASAIAVAVPGIAAGAPAVPDDATVQAAVDVALPFFIR